MSRRCWSRLSREATQSSSTTLPATKSPVCVKRSRRWAQSSYTWPPYSPDLNPIELAFAKFKTGLRKAAERTVDDLWRRIGVLLHDFSPQECQNYFCHDGYASS